jgi:putative oxidoreductase
MQTFFAKYEPYCYAIARIVVGALFACHGAQKLFGVLGGHSELNDPEGLIAGIVEFGAGVLVALGLFTRVAAFLASGEMAVAYFKTHAARGFWPIMNRGELAVLFCFAFLCFCFRGYGALGLDGMLGRRSAKAG